MTYDDQIWWQTATTLSKRGRMIGDRNWWPTRYAIKYPTGPEIRWRWPRRETIPSIGTESFWNGITVASVDVKAHEFLSWMDSIYFDRKPNKIARIPFVAKQLAYLNYRLVL